ncbi:MAG: hypothetical protein ACTSW1_07630 [Candidatus Hodarchaeales archaeon]
MDLGEGSIQRTVRWKMSVWERMREFGKTSNLPTQNAIFNYLTELGLDSLNGNDDESSSKSDSPDNKNDGDESSSKSIPTKNGDESSKSNEPDNKNGDDSSPDYNWDHLEL